MGRKLEKMKKRLLSEPPDYSYYEASTLLSHLGFTVSTKGRASGSRVQFYREADKKSISLHKPHPSSIMDKGAVKDLKSFLLESGEL